jgi:hypothetical protein
MPDLNTEIRDKILIRNHLLQRFENGTIRDMVGHYNTAKAQVASALQELVDTGQGWTLQYRIDRLNAQMRQIDMILKNANADAVNELSYSLNGLGETEKEFYEKLLSDRLGKVGVEIMRIPFEQVAEMVDTPLGGALYSERMVKNYGDALFQMKNELTQSIIQGEDMAKASRRLTGIGAGFTGEIGNRLQKQAKVIARTEIQRVSGQVATRIFNENQDILKGVQHASNVAFSMARFTTST